ncbi:hypothetical protein VNI00_010562 [Paramarasmius palmivorus]|uniref:Uncharacterized protein n=1 Tax=Paramarasmius palmivorus TaxID=297713 RepID=A0AAW0CJ53_9AGAR
MLGLNYPYEKAAILLEHLATERTSSGAIANALATFADAFPDTSTDVTTSEAGNGHTWHLTTRQDEGQPPEEIVFTVQGVILQCDLPPVVRPYGRFVSPRHVQQRVLLTGLNTATFSRALDGLARVDSLLRKAIRDNEGHVITGNTDGFTTIDVANRYFTSKRFANDEHHIGFTTDVDPKGILNDLRGEAFVHTADNVVEFYQRLNTNGDQRFKKIPPSTISEGDIVEVQITVSLVEHSAGKGRNTNVQYFTKLVLRTLTLLDKSYSKVSQPLIAKTNTRPILKRKVGYTEEETKTAEQRMKRMVIDTTTGSRHS